MMLLETQCQSLCSIEINSDIFPRIITWLFSDFPDSLNDQAKEDNEAKHSEMKAKLLSTTNFTTSSTKAKPEVADVGATDSSTEKLEPHDRTLINTESLDVRKTLTNTQSIHLRKTLTNNFAAEVAKPLNNNNKTANSSIPNANEKATDNTENKLSENSITITESMVQMPEIKMEPNEAVRVSLQFSTITKS